MGDEQFINGWSDKIPDERLREEYEKLARAFVESDDYLRAIRSEELDGSEPELGKLLEQNATFWHPVEEPKQ